MILKILLSSPEFLAQPLLCETRGKNEARTLLAFPPEADEPMVQAKFFISFWLKPNMF
jgi:hypothetical protein